MRDSAGGMRARKLAAAVGAKLAGPDADAVDIRGLAVDSRLVRPGDLFVALPGARADGSAFVADALSRGAVAVGATALVPGVPTLIVPDVRAAVAPLAAALYDYPARKLSLVGITGTLGKTSTALLVEAALGATGRAVGVIGSLGVRVRRQRVDEIPGVAGMTTPDAPAIHAALRHMVDAGVELAVMEVTSHAIAQGRVAGLEFALGVFTNLVPDEHLEFHSTPEDYVRTKLRFLDQLAPAAPLVIDHDDERLRDATRAVPGVVTVSASGADAAAVVMERLRSDADGSTFSLRVRRTLRGTDGRLVDPIVLPLALSVFGAQQAANAALAATAALLAGASPVVAAAAVADVRPIRRRMDVVRAAAPFVLDDTVGNPRSLRAVFASVRAALPAARLRIAFGIRGSRGVTINAALGRALAECVGEELARGTAVRLVVTASEDAAGERDRVRRDELRAVIEALSAAGIRFDFAPTVGEAVGRALDGWHPNDAVLLIGAQGMDTAAETARAILGDHR